MTVGMDATAVGDSGREAVYAELSGAQAQEATNTPVQENAPSTPDGTGAPAQQAPVENWQERYNNLQPAYTKTTQELAQIKAENEALRRAIGGNAAQTPAPAPEPELSDDEFITAGQARRLTTGVRQQVKVELEIENTTQEFRDTYPELKRFEHSIAAAVAEKVQAGMPIRKAMHEAAKEFKDDIAKMSAPATQAAVQAAQARNAQAAQAAGLGTVATAPAPAPVMPETTEEYVNQRNQELYRRQGMPPVIAR